MSTVNTTTEFLFIVSLMLTLSLLCSFPRISYVLWHSIREGIEDYKRKIGFKRTEFKDKRFVEIDVRGNR